MPRSHLLLALIAIAFACSSSEKDQNSSADAAIDQVAATAPDAAPDAERDTAPVSGGAGDGAPDRSTSCLTVPLPTVKLAMVDSLAIVAADTDPLITGEPTKKHRVYRPPAGTTLRPHLLVFLGGSGGQPSNHQDIMKIWASAGYRALSLSYMNEISIADLCAGTRDPNCEKLARREIIYGDTTNDSTYTTVTAADSIQYRLRRLLEHLNVQQPAAGFGDYLDAKGTILWDKIVIGGWSQGGGHAGLIAQDHLVARAFYLSKGIGQWDDGTGIPQISPHVNDPRATPASRTFGIVHELEDAWSYTPRVFDIWGLDDFGAFVRVDDQAAPYACTHQLSTRFTPECGGMNYHKSMTTDDCLARDPATGQPRLTAAYLSLVLADW